MIKNALIGMALVIGSTNALASATDLIGKWTTQCSQDNPGATQYTRTLNEFRTDGTIASTSESYTNAQCSGSPVTQAPILGTYIATDNTLSLNAAVSGHSYSVTGTYQIAGDFLFFIVRKALVDGRDVTVSSPVTQMQRVH
jgi:hypothetical protein